MGRKMKRLYSVLTDDLDHCMFTGTAPVERHHVFGGAYRRKSEIRGFIAPLRPDLHPNGVFAGKDAMVKVVCQDAVKTLHFAPHAAFMAAICSGVIVSMPSS